MPNEYSVAELERILQKKKTRLDALIRKRNQLQKRLAQLEQKIKEIGGVVREPRAERRSRRRPKNAKTLIEAVVEVLAQHKKGLSLRNLAEKLLESGYKTASSNFPNTLYQCLYHNAEKLNHDAKTHIYRVK